MTRRIGGTQCVRLELLSQLSSLDGEWELIIVNDGSRDGSEEIARRLERTSPRLRVLGYPHNRGRGHALRTGIAAARGDLIVTTEIDLSWGSTIVQDLVAATRQHPDADMIVASTAPTSRNAARPANRCVAA